MQIRCNHCGEILNISEKLLGKKSSKGSCPNCFKLVEISKKNEYLETPSEFALRLQKKGILAVDIQQKMLESEIEPHQIELILKELKNSLSLEKQKAFGNIKSENQLETKWIDEKFCGDCGAIIKTEAEICYKCGGHQIEIQKFNRVFEAIMTLLSGGLEPKRRDETFCNRCYTRIKTKAKFCYKCGVLK